MKEPMDLEPMSSELRGLLDEARALKPAPGDVRARLFSRVSADLFGPLAAPPAADPASSSSTAESAPSSAASSASSAAPQAMAAAMPQAVATTTAAGATAAWTSTAVGALVLGVGVVSFAVGGVVGTQVERARVEQAAQVAPVQAAVAETLPTPSAPPLVIPAEPAPPPSTTPIVKPVTPGAVPLADDRLGIERSLVEQARNALARNAPEAALEALASHRRRFPEGAMGEERDALTVVALAKLGRPDDARAEAERFRQRFPASLLRPLVDSVSPPR